jgi:glycosyltransferase involved in cell wall biosynthesis
MKVIQIPFCFAPDPVGGTEIYVANLARDLQKIGVNAIIAAPGATTTSYHLDGLEVRRYALGEVTDVSELYGAGDQLAAKEFAKIIDDENPDVLHLHAFTAGVSLRIVQAAKARGIPVVFTYHTPTVTCQRGTLLRWGKHICDGEIRVARCAGCALNGLGMPAPIAAAVGMLPSVIGRQIGRLGLRGRAWTALRSSQLIGLRRDTFEAMIADVDQVVAVCDWVHDVLTRNGVPAKKLSLSRHGIDFDANLSPPRITDPEITRIAFLGRLDVTKGVHVVLAALASLPKAKIHFDIYGVSQGSSDYLEELRRIANNDPRVRFHDPIAHDEVIARLRRYDFLAVPSQWMETGPLVVLEAFAAGVPVIGWDMGGVRELVRNNVDGLLISPTDTWTKTLELISAHRGLRTRLKSGVRPPKHSSVVADEMSGLYRALVGAVVVANLPLVPPNGDASIAGELRKPLN